MLILCKIAKLRNLKLPARRSDYEKANLHNRQRTNGYTMVIIRASYPRTNPVAKRRPTSSVKSCVFGGNHLDSPYGRALAPYARTLPSGSTCWRRFTEWQAQGIWLKIWQPFLGILDKKSRLKWENVFADGMFVPAKKGGWK